MRKKMVLNLGQTTGLGLYQIISQGKLNLHIFLVTNDFMFWNNPTEVYT